ncbi:hypothetical protein ACWJJH_02380 [Endozoicomonadaceae bacterium StTr2]
MKKAIIILSVMLLSGCAGSGPYYKYYWQKEGTSYQQAVTVEAGCQYEVGMAKFDNPSEKQQIIEACMKKEGFRWGRYVVSNGAPVNS